MANISSLLPVAKAYARRIKRGDITLADVPEDIRAMVSQIVEEAAPASAPAQDAQVATEEQVPYNY